MNASSIIVVPKMSKYEWDMHTYRLMPNELIEKYTREGVDADVILSSHNRQKESEMMLRKFFSENQFISRELLTGDVSEKAELVIALGGDNHFQYVSHFIENTLIMGVNSDTMTSEGALTYYTAVDFDRLLRKLDARDFNVEEWTRLEARINGYNAALATSEYFLGERERSNMSRHNLMFKNEKEEHKCSGLIIATGAGSTGWYDAACRYLHPNGNAFPKDSGYCIFLASEPFRGKRDYRKLEGRIEKDQELEVVSLNNSDGILSADSMETYNFSRGSKAVIRISDLPLRVVKVRQ